MINFNKIFNQVTFLNFLDSYWTKKEFISLDNEVRNLITLKDLELLIEINANHFNENTLRLIKDGKILPSKKYFEVSYKRKQGYTKTVSLLKILEYCQNGYTLSFNDINNYSKNLYDLGKNITSLFLGRVHINAYLSQIGSRGFNYHFDHHEIFVIQLAGKKKWDLYNIENIIPEHTETYYKQGEPNFNSKREYVLEPGSILYIPRGMWHNAFAEESSSLHLTIGITMPTISNFTCWYFSNFAKYPELNNYIKDYKDLEGFIDTIVESYSLESTKNNFIDDFLYGNSNLKNNFRLPFN